VFSVKVNPCGPTEGLFNTPATSELANASMQLSVRKIRGGKSSCMNRRKIRRVIVLQVDEAQPQPADTAAFRKKNGEKKRENAVERQCAR
jgi:hypothetical protein